MKNRVAITGAGVLSPLGDSPQLLHEALCAGRSALGPIELFATDPLAEVEAAEIRGFDPGAYIEGNLRPLDRSSMLATAAAGLALATAERDPRTAGGETTGLVLGTMFGSIHTISEFDRRGLTAGPSYAKPLVFANTVINAAAGQTAIRLGLHGVNSTIAGGSASGLQALGYAADLIRSGRNEAVLAGGCEELSFEALLGFHRAGRLAGSADSAPQAVPFARHRNGFALGEGAAFLLLEGEREARSRSVEVLGTVLGFAQTFDPSRGRNADSAADALARAITLALRDAAVDASAVGCVFTSANGGVAGDRHEGHALAHALGRHRPPIAAIKSMIGEALGAGGALQAVAALEAVRRGAVAGICRLEEPEPDLAGLGLSSLVRSPTGPVALITALGLDGAAVALLLTAERD